MPCEPPRKHCKYWALAHRPDSAGAGAYICKQRSASMRCLFLPYTAHPPNVARTPQALGARAAATITRERKVSHMCERLCDSTAMPDPLTIGAHRASHSHRRHRGLGLAWPSVAECSSRQLGNPRRSQHIKEYAIKCAIPQSLRYQAIAYAPSSDANSSAV